MMAEMLGYLLRFNATMEPTLLLLLGFIFQGAGMLRVWQWREGRLHRELHVTGHTPLFITSE